jgi:ribosome-associated protein
MDNFNLGEREFIPLCDLLKKVGFCQTGGHAKLVITDGLVKVDGKIELRKRCKVREGQKIEFESQVITVLK